MPSDLFLRAVLSGVLGARGKKARKATRYLTGGRHGLLANPATLLTAAGLAWGVVETLQQQGAQDGARATAPGAPDAAAAAPPPPPPIPAERGAVDSADSGASEALRLVRLAVSAAAADGRLSEAERAAVAQQATAAGFGEVVERELAAPRPLAEIVAGVTDRTDAATLYVLAFTILRADEQVSGAERIYLARLAQMLGLDPATAASLEVETGARIDALGDQGQQGG